MTTKEAVSKLIEELKADPEYYYSWQANIAMAFKDEWSRRASDCPTVLDTGNLDIHEIANTAAKEFLDILICKYCDLAEEIGM